MAAGVFVSEVRISGGPTERDVPERPYEVCYWDQEERSLEPKWGQVQYRVQRMRTED
jgi:hypothetical protein